MVFQGGDALRDVVTRHWLRAVELEAEHERVSRDFYVCYPGSFVHDLTVPHQHRHGLRVNGNLRLRRVFVGFSPERSVAESTLIISWSTSSRNLRNPRSSPGRRPVTAARVSKGATSEMTSSAVWR
jgi:hypothetical protein